MTQHSLKRIAILGTRGIPAAYGGFETFAEEVAVRLAKAGVEVTVYCESGQGVEPVEYQGVKLRYVPSPACGPLTTVLFDLRCLWNARKDFDVVYMLGYGAAQFCFIPRLFGSRVWINVDGIEWARAKWSGLAKTYFRLMEWFSMRTPNRVIADAGAIRDHLVARHRHMPACSVIAYGAPIIDTPPPAELLATWGLNPGQYHLVVCRLEPENHVREIIEGYAASASAYPLVILGNHKADTGYVRSLLPLASERVRFIGTVFDKARLQALRYHASVYFHGHSVGGTNPSLLEAMGCGNLTIAHANVFNREVLGDLGSFFDSPAAIPALLAELEALSEINRDLKRNEIRGRVRQLYDWDLIACQYLDLLKADTQPDSTSKHGGLL